MTTRTSPAPAGLLRPSLHYLAFAVALGSAGAALAKDVTWEDIANDDKTTGDVLQYGMGTHAQRWSPLKQVNADNVFKLTRPGRTPSATRNSAARSPRPSSATA